MQGDKMTGKRRRSVVVISTMALMALGGGGQAFGSTAGEQELDRCEPAELPFRAAEQYVLPTSDAAVVAAGPAFGEDVRREYALMAGIYREGASYIRDYEQPGDEIDLVCHTLFDNVYPVICPRSAPNPNNANGLLGCANEFGRFILDPIIGG
jgi:hypothetical protein